MDFVADQLVDGTQFRALTIVDVFTRQALAIAVGQRLRTEDVVKVNDTPKTNPGNGPTKPSGSQIH